MNLMQNGGLILYQGLLDAGENINLEAFRINLDKVDPGCASGFQKRIQCGHLNENGRQSATLGRPASANWRSGTRLEPPAHFSPAVA